MASKPGEIQIEDDDYISPERIKERGDARNEMFGSLIVSDKDGTPTYVGPDVSKSPMSAAVDADQGEDVGIATGEDYIQPTEE